MINTGLVWDSVYLQHDTGLHVENALRVVAIMSHLEKIGMKSRLPLVAGDKQVNVILIVSLSAALMVAAVLFGVGRTITGPILRLAREVRAIEKSGRLRPIALPYRGLELATLQGAINRMVATVKAQMEEIRIKDQAIASAQASQVAWEVDAPCPAVDSGHLGKLLYQLRHLLGRDLPALRDPLMYLGGILESDAAGAAGRDDAQRRGLYGVIEPHVHAAPFATQFDRCHLALSLDQPFVEQKPQRQFFQVGGGTHQAGQWLAVLVF